MYRLKQSTLLIIDLLLLYLGLYAGIAVRFFDWADEQTLGLLLGPMSLLFGIAAVIFFIAGLYDVGKTKNSWQFFYKLIVSALIWLALAVGYFYINPRTVVTPKTILLLAALFGFGLVALWRYLYNRYLSTTIWQTIVVFAGITPEVMESVQLIERQPEQGYRIGGFIIPSGTTLPPELATYPAAVKLYELVEKNNGRYPAFIVIAPALATNADLLGDLYQALFKQTTIVSLEKFYEDVAARVPPFTFSESWFIAHLKEQEKRVYDRIRILIDYLLASLMGLGFIITWPLIALAIKLTSPGPALFRQTRVGLQGRLFTINKYRTMKVLSNDGSAEISGPQFASRNDNRITAVGKFLRRTRLDELPQFINILRGEMGLVGPRPERPEFVAELTKAMPFYSLRHLIKPGLTGWAQLHKEYYGTLEENLYKLQYDLFYIKNRGFLLDVAILLKTINVLIRMAGR